MSLYYLGVDGGGSKTEFCVGDANGERLFSVSTGATSFKSVGKETAYANILAGLRGLEEKGISPADIRKGIWGLSGCDTESDRKVYAEMLLRAGLSPEIHRVVNDSLLAFYAAAECPGLVVIAGTGSIVVGLDSSGNMHRLGGWSYVYSDLGSGYYLGSRLLRETALWLEDCRDADPVFPAVLAKLNTGDGWEALCKMAEITDGDGIASFARIVLDGKDSSLCASLRKEAVGYLCQYASGMCRRLTALGEEKLTLVLSGGLFKSESFRREMEAELQKLDGLTVIWNTRSAGLGGIRMARNWDRKE